MVSYSLAISNAVDEWAKNYLELDNDFLVVVEDVVNRGGELDEAPDEFIDKYIDVDSLIEIIRRNLQDLLSESVVLHAEWI